jgi:O-antigen/teichoic acid export membrane protein
LQFDGAVPERLRNRALRAGVWTLGAYGIELCARLLSNIILARLLFPEAFGTVAAASALIAGLVLVTDFGVRAVIIQSSRGDEVAFLRSAWTFQLCRGVAIWAILLTLCWFISVPALHELLPVGSVFAGYLFPLILAVSGFSLVLGGAESAAIPLNIRRLNFRPIVTVDLVSRIASLPIMFIWAWITPNVWSLIGGGLAGNIFRLILSHTIVPGPRMSLRWERDHVGEILRFGGWIAVSSFGTFISQQSDVILLGLLVPASTLGIYSIAKILVGAAEGILDRLTYSLSLPVLGEVIRKDRSNFRNLYYRFRLPIDFLAALLSGILFTAGTFIVNFLYDERYSQAGTMLEILAVGLMIYPFLVVRSAFTATGDTHIVAGVSILQAISLLSFMAIGFLSLGPLGAIAGVAIHRIIPATVTVLLSHRHGWIGIWQELRIVPIFIAGAFIGKGIPLIGIALDIKGIHQFFR